MTCYTLLKTAENENLSVSNINFQYKAVTLGRDISSIEIEAMRNYRTGGMTDNGRF